MTSGEKCVWAAVFATASFAGKYPQEAATMAGRAVRSVRQAQAMDGMPFIDGGVDENAFTLECIRSMIGEP